MDLRIVFFMVVGSLPSNIVTAADQDGEYDDWIGLANLTDQAVLLSGMYLSDKDSNPRKWMFPEGTIIEPNGYIIVWADEDSDQVGLHANFKLSNDGETITLVDSDARDNLLLDSVTYGEIGKDVSYGRTGVSGSVSELSPTPGS